MVRYELENIFFNSIGFINYLRIRRCIFCTSTRHVKQEKTTVRSQFRYTICDPFVGQNYFCFLIFITLVRFSGNKQTELNDEEFILLGDFGRIYEFLKRFLFSFQIRMIVMRLMIKLLVILFTIIKIFV